MTRPVVDLTPVDGLVEVRPRTFLGDELFRTFRSAVAGAKYNPKRKRSFAPLDKVPAILRRLRAADFDVQMGLELVRLLQQETAQRWTDLTETRERIDAIEREFMPRTGKRFFPYQRTGSVWLALKHTALLADDMGLGKTLQGIAAIPSQAPVLVVCPATLKENWRAELAEWRPHLQVRVLEGRDSFRWPMAGEVVILNYDILPEVHEGAMRRNELGRSVPCEGYLDVEPCPGCMDVATARDGMMVLARTGHLKTCTGFFPKERCPGCATFLRECPSGTVLLLDEVHRCKDGRALRSTRAAALATRIRDTRGRTWGLTGTPVENKPSELWSVLLLVGAAHEAFGSWGQFLELANARPNMVTVAGGQIKQYGYEWSSPDDRYAEHLHRVMLRRLKTDVLPQLPTKRYRTLQVEIDKKTLAECEKLLSSCGDLEALLAQPDLAFETLSTVRQALARAKTPAAIKLIEDFEDAGEPAVVFSMHRAPIDQIAKRSGWGSITGDDSPSDRMATVKAFQDGKLRGIAATIPAASEGITLTRAANVLFIDQSFKPTQNDQAEDRLVRIGQTRGVVVTILAAKHPLDLRVTEILLGKRRIITENVDAGASLEDAVRVSDLEEDLRTLQVEIASGRAVRREARSEEEIAALSDLRTKIFARSDERLVCDLVEEADLIGLSEAQWSLVLRLSRRAIVPDQQQLLQKPEPLPEPESVMPPSQDDPLKPILRLIARLTDADRADLFEGLEALYCISCGVSEPEDDHDCEEEDDEEDDDEDDDAAG